MSVHTLRIDGADVAGAVGQSILEVATENGIEIPTLCHLDGLSDVGACRLCVVEVQGSGKLLPACVTRVEEGMEVVAHSERLAAYRRTIVEMLFVERNHICAVCVANNHCELQDLAAGQGVTHLDLPAVNPLVDVDASHPLFAIDHNRCIMCTRCVRVCDEIEGAHTWDVMGRGIDARVVTDLGTPWGSSPTCTSCGKCVQVCPTGALFEKGRSVGEGSKQRRPFLPYLKRVGEAGGAMSKPRLATVWLDGCSGCHMSFLDMDERLLEIGERADLVYSPLVDRKDYPEGVDVCLVEGAVSSEEDLRKIRTIRERTRTLVSFGDCAVTSNVPGMRNPIGAAPLLERAYLENVTLHPQVPSEVVPRLLEQALPVHQVVKVDVFLPGCPPSADLIYATLNELLEGRVPDTARDARFGA